MSSRSAWAVLLCGVILTAASLSCSVGEALLGRPVATAASATKTPRPTFTAWPGVSTPLVTPGLAIRGDLPPGVTAAPPESSSAAVSARAIAGTATPGANGSVGTTNLILIATPTSPPSPTPEATATEAPTATPTPDSETNRPTPLAGPRPLPTPYVVVRSDGVNGRRGPGVTFPLVGEAKQGAELMILARTPAGDWWQVCCISNQPAWVANDLVDALGPLDEIAVLTPPPTPVPTPAPPPTATPLPTATRRPPFDIARGPEFPLKKDDGILTIWGKVYEGPSTNEKPLTGYLLKVFRDGADVSSSVRSSAPFDEIASFTLTTKTVQYLYNIKFEMYGASEADWEIYLANGDGYRVSPVAKFTTKGDSYRNLTVYIAYWLAR